MAASMFLVSVGRHQGSQRCFWTMPLWMAIRYLGGISDFPMAERDIFTNAYQETYRVSGTWQRPRIMRDASSRWEKRKCIAQCTSSTTGSAILSSHAVITHKFWVLNEQQQAFARVVRLGQNWVPHTWWPNTGPGGSDNRPCDFHKHCGVAQMSVLHRLMSRPNITRSMIYRILEAREDHTKRLTENGDTLQSDQPLNSEC
jgi:hypothetical protein